MQTFLTFEKFLTPSVIQIIYWIALAAVVVSSLGVLVMENFWFGLVGLVLGPLWVRVVCELTLVVFQIHERLREIRDGR